MEAAQEQRGVDLHLHSEYSCDGQFSPSELLAKASNCGLGTISITDHNTVRAYQDMSVGGSSQKISIDGIKIIPGVELDTTFDKRFGLHLLGYYIDCQNQQLLDFLEEIESVHKWVVNRQLSRLQALGFELNRHHIEKYKNDKALPGSATLACAVLEEEKNNEHPLLASYRSGGKRDDQPCLNFINDFFGPAGPARVKVDYPPTERAVGIIREIGGIPVLAHPGHNLGSLEDRGRPVIRQLKAAGLAGLEVYSSYHSRKETEFYKKLATEEGLVKTAGSDFHGHLKPEVVPGTSRFMSKIRQVPGTSRVLSEIIEELNERL